MQFFRLSFFIFLLVSCSKPEKASYQLRTDNPDFLHRTMKEITDRMVHDIFSPPVASRIYAYSSVAAYEAIIHMDTMYVSMAGQLHGLQAVPKPDPRLEYCFPLASTQAMLKVGRSLIFSEKDFDKHINQIHDEFLKAGVPQEVYDRSVEFGDVIASHIVAWAASDNYQQTRSLSKYTVDNSPGTWKPTPPAYMDGIEPFWNQIRTFVLDSSSQFRPPAPTPFSTSKASQFYKEAMEVYDMGRNLTEEHQAIARFWDCNPFAVNVRGHVMFASKKISPGGHWVNISKVACYQSKAGIVQSAEAYVRVSLSLADAFISCWDEKYRSRLIRPETYINQYVDKNWLPLLQTPPFPEYTSGHSVISASASVALTDLFGSDYAFTDSTEVEYSLSPRSFKSFSHAAAEAGISRMYGGIHYRPAVENGMRQGTAVGDWFRQKVVTRKK